LEAQKLLTFHVIYHVFSAPVHSIPRYQNASCLHQLLRFFCSRARPTPWRPGENYRLLPYCPFARLRLVETTGVIKIESHTHSEGDAQEYLCQHYPRYEFVDLQCARNLPLI